MTTDPREEVDRLADRLEGTPLYEGCGEESCLPENAAGWLRSLAAENAALREKLEAAEAALADGSFYKESDIDALQDRAAKAEAALTTARAKIAKEPAP